MAILSITIVIYLAITKVNGKLASTPDEACRAKSTDQV
jgi:hypothetical protein